MKERKLYDFKMGIKTDPEQWKNSADDGRPTIVRNMNMSFEERAKAYGFKPQVRVLYNLTNFYISCS